MDKDTRKMLKALVDAGFTWEQRKSNHIMIRKDGKAVATFSGTSSDWRGMKNTLAALKREGFVWPPRR